MDIFFSAETTLLSAATTHLPVSGVRSPNKKLPPTKALQIYLSLVVSGTRTELRGISLFSKSAQTYQVEVRTSICLASTDFVLDPVTKRHFFVFGKRVPMLPADE